MADSFYNPNFINDQIGTKQVGIGSGLFGQDWGSIAPIENTTNLPTISSPDSNTLNGGSSWLTNLFGGTNKDGSTNPNLVGAGVGALKGIFDGYLGMKQYGLAKQQLAFSKDSFNRNYAAQKATTNASLEDRQRARVASTGNPNSTAYQSVGAYMKQNGIV